MVIQWRITDTEGTDTEGADTTGAEGGEMSRRRYISNSGRYYLPPGYYDADWSYYSPTGRSRSSRSRSSRSGRRKNIHNWAGRAHYGAIGASFGAMVAVDNWRMRGDYYSAYYRRTGKRPNKLRYNKLTRRMVKK